jgi:hypothetical protein
MPLKDTAPPDDEMVRQANDLAEFTRSHPLASDEAEWMESCGVPVGLTRDELTPYLDELNLVVDRDRSEPTIYVVPQWDEEHAIYLAVRDGRVEFQDL